MRIIYKISCYIIIYLLVFVEVGSAQDKASQLNAKQIKEFEVSLKKKCDATMSLEAAFTQEKSLEMLSKKMVSKGVFKFKREDKISFAYFHPYKYLIIINGKKLKIVNNGKNQIVDLSNNPMMNQMKGLIEASFLGRLSEMGSEYKILYYSNADNIEVVIIPKNRSVSNMINKISVFFNIGTLDIIKLRLDEGSKSSTTYYFQDQKFNTLKDDESFSVS